MSECVYIGIVVIRNGFSCIMNKGLGYVYFIDVYSGFLEVEIG